MVRPWVELKELNCSLTLEMPASEAISPGTINFNRSGRLV
jgi:hypothetical protein